MYAYRAARKLADAHIDRAMALTPDSLKDPSVLEAEPGLTWGFLDAETLHRAMAHATDLDIDEAFVREALARGDRCYGAMDGDVLASSGWYSTRPTPFIDDLDLVFAEGWAYMYKGYTAHSHRGRRLHGIGMARAMDAYVREGYRGLVSYVDAANDASLKSCARLGYRTFGTLLAAKVGGHWITHATPGCAPYGLRLERRLAQSAPHTDVGMQPVPTSSVGVEVGSQRAS